jgi:hypothetical protein
MGKENQLSNLEQRKTTISHMISEKGAWIGRIGYGKINVKSSVDVAVRVGEIRDKTKNYINKLNSELAEVSQGLEAFNYLSNLEHTKESLVKIKEMVSKGSLTEEEVKPHFDKLKELESLPEKDPILKNNIEKIIQERKSEEKPAEITSEAIKSPPTLEIDRNSGNVTIIEGQQIRTIKFGERIIALQVFLALAKKPNQPIDTKTIIEAALKAGSKHQNRPAGENIGKIRNLFGQTEKGFQYITVDRHGKTSNYILNAARIIFVGEKTKDTASTTAKPEASKNIIPIAKIALDKDDQGSGVLTINGK